MKRDLKGVEATRRVASTEIILASNSKQREKLLRMVGLKFTIVPSHVREKNTITSSCAMLVKRNALLKAQEIALKVKGGIIIAADTVVYDGKGHLIGKPRNYKEAKQILRKLFSHPHWVYTGVAVVNAKTKRRIVDCEKTKIFMNKISEEEIDRYHQHTFPLDKAGGFDIEGRGGLFIRRIEGCFTNVIGLPLSKLRVMLKKMGVPILGLFLWVCLLGGCTTEYNLATGKQETLLYGTEKEIKIGDAIVQQMEANYKFNIDFDVNERVQKILDRIVEVCDRKELVYTIKVIEEDKVNAVSLPGGYLYVFKGLLDQVKNDDQLAGVIAHEVGHITAKHAMKRLQAAYGYTLLQILAVSSGDREAASGTSAILTSIFFAHSREDEFEADKLAVKYTKKAGYDPSEMIIVLKILQEEDKKGPRKPISYFRTHPFIPERIAVVGREISGQIEFRDYLNLPLKE